MGRHSSSTIRTSAITATATGAMCFGLAMSAASASMLPPSVQDLIADGVITDDTRTDATTDYFSGLPAGTVMVITPGTDDTTLRPRIDNLVGNRPTLLVNYPQSFGPIIGGQSGKFPLFAPSYDASKKKAEEGNLTVMEAFRDDPNVTFAVYSGYSQGADALGNAVEQAVRDGLINPNKSLVVLTSDPRGPWGLKQGLNKFPLVPQLASLIGADIDGARDPADTGAVEVIQIIVTGDPVGNWQLDPLRPVSSMVVNAAGFFGCHSDPACYGNLEQYGPPTVYKSVDGRTTYHVYKSEHPLVLVMRNVYEDLGIEYTEEDVERWEKKAQAFYPITEPSVNNSAVPVYAVTAPMMSTSGTPEPIVSLPDVLAEDTPADVEESAPVVEPVVPEASQGDSNDSSPTVTPVAPAPALGDTDGGVDAQTPAETVVVDDSTPVADTTSSDPVTDEPSGDASELAEVPAPVATDDSSESSDTIE